MSPERLHDLEALYFELVDLPFQERERRLAELTDSAVREDLRALLQASVKTEVSAVIGSAASSILETLAPERFGPWRVTGILGTGGMGAVYRAQRDDGVYQREVAIKVLPRRVESSVLRNRFVQERQILATFDHPNIAHMLDGGESGTGPYIVLEFIDGADIVAYCEARKLSIKDRLRLFLPVCAAVQYAHDRGIIHRDLKPANVLVTQHGTPKLLDFGIAKLVDRSTLETVAGFQPFTPQYASPEQICGGPFSACTDVYSLGALLYEMLTGARPHEITSGDPAELVRVICEQEVPRARTIAPGLDRDLDLILEKALRKEPERRYGSVGLFAQDITRYLEGKPVLARPESIAYRVAKAGRRHSSAVIGSVALLLLLATIAIRFHARSSSASQPVFAPLTSLPGTEVSPSFSPDGKQIAFTWDGDGGDYNVYTKHLDSGSLLKITQGQSQNVNPAWSPDGRQIAFLRIMPDGTDLMIKELGGAERHIVRVNPTTEKLALAQFRFRYYGPAWSPDGKDLAVVDTCPVREATCIYLVSASTGQERILTSPGANGLGDRLPAFSPDGAFLAFSRSKSMDVSDVYIERIRTGQTVRRTFDGSGIEGITWSHDGASVIFASQRSGAPRLWEVPRNGGAIRPIDTGGRNVVQPAISPDGHRLAYVEDVINQNIWRTAVHSGRNNRPAKLVWSSRRSDSPRYSPDGKRLAFVSDRSGNWEIWMSNADGTDEKQMTAFGRGLTGSPHWSPDNRQIVFDSRQEGYSAVYILSVAGSKPHRITEGIWDDMLPCWSRDGQWIYFNSNRTGSHEIWKTPVAGGPAVQITRNGAYEPYESTDGRYLYFWKYRGTGVWRIGTQGGEEEPVAALADYAHTRYFDIGGHGIYFVANRNTPHIIQFFSFATGHVSPIAEIESKMVNGTPGLSVSPDEQWIAYAQEDYDSTDIYMVENFR